MNRSKGCEAELSNDPQTLEENGNRAARIIIKKRGNNPADIQFMYFPGIKLKAGEHYLLQYQIMVSKPVEFPVDILCQRDNHFFRPGKDATSRFSTGGGTWEEGKLDFIAEEESPGNTVFRIPNFYLGNLPPGTEFRCSDIKLWLLK